MPTAALRKPMPETLHERYAHVKERIAASAERSGQRPENIMLVAVTGPLRCASMMPWLVNRPKPKSSAVTIRESKFISKAVRVGL